jgi:hypothetical protein
MEAFKMKRIILLACGVCMAMWIGHPAFAQEKSVQAKQNVRRSVATSKLKAGLRHGKARALLLARRSPETSPNRSMGNEAVATTVPTAYAHGGALYIQSPRAEQVTVYSLTGTKVYEGAVQAGTTTVNAARLPKGVYVVAFGGGTRQKIWVSEQ